MNELPKRKQNRIDDYDYSAPGTYFITVCTAGREKLFWEGSASLPDIRVGADIIRPETVPLSPAGKIAQQGIMQIPEHYGTVAVDHFCIMPDHVHLLLRLSPDKGGRILSAPTLSTVVGSMKRWVSKQIGRSIWQKSFYDHAIRNEQDYDEVWRYIENNPLKYALTPKNTK